MYILSSCNYVKSEVKNSVSLENTTFWSVEACSDQEMLEINSAMFESGVCTVAAFFIIYLIIPWRTLCCVSLIYFKRSHSIFVISNLLPVHLRLSVKGDTFLELSDTNFYRYNFCISSCLCCLLSHLIHLKLTFQSV